MLVIFGANGRTGIAILKEALRQGIPVRPIVRDDRDGRGLDAIVDVNDVCYADPDNPASLPPVLEGATQVISCINARTAGPDCPTYGDHAGVNIVRAGAAAGADCVLHMSAVGTYRWSPNKLNRRGFHVDKHVRQAQDLPWTMIRVSSYFDEVIEGHVRPPDGRRPHRLPLSGRNSPMSRRDVARMVVNHLPALIPHRTLYVGGPDMFSGAELRALIAPHVVKGRGVRKTRFGALPPGDMCIDPDVTRIMVTTRPRDRLIEALDPSAVPPAPVEPPPVYARVKPGPHPADEGRNLKPLREMGEALRRTVHAQLIADLVDMSLPVEGVTLDFRAARQRRGTVAADVHGGSIRPMTGVAAKTPDGEELYRGATMLVRDTLADEFYIWFERETGVPEHIWAQLDVGVRRRMVVNPAFKDDPRVQTFGGGHEVVSL